MPELAYRLPEIPYLRLRVTLRAQERALLPGYRGSMLRGAFGHALRAMVCAMGPKQPCRTCPLRHECIYPRLFETLIEGEPPPFLKGLPTAPRPYVFEPALAEMGTGQDPGGGGEDQSETGHRSYAPGEPLRFDLLLFGRAVDLQAHAVLAIERMAQAGLGSRRSRFSLERVEYQNKKGDWQTGYQAGETRWQASVPASVPRPGPLAERLASGRAELRLLTPLRLSKDGRLASDFNFRKLAFRIVRRTLELAHFHLPEPDRGALDWHFRPLLEAASGVRITDRELSWYDWERWSNRQQSSMHLGGQIGRLRLEGALAPFAQLLATAELIHVGKGTTFGLGWVEVG